MDQKKDKKALFDAESYVAIFTGTAVRTIAALAQGLSLKTGQNSELLCRHLFFDFMQHLPQSLSAELGLDIDQIFGPESFVSSAIPTDPESLAKADEAGLLGPMSQGWYLNPAIGGDNKGAAGNPCLGYVQALFNKRALKRRLHRLIQEAIDHARGNTLVLEGMEENSVLARLVIHLYFSTVGGTGPGSMPWFISEDGIRSCAQQDGVQSNIVLHVIGRGNLPTHDTSLADLNEVSTLK